MLKRALFFLLLLATCGAQAAPAILVFGDSLSAGYGIAAGADWVSLLNQRLKQTGHNYRVINASIGGETTRGGMQRFGQTLAKHRPVIVILELGANDGLRGLPIEAARGNLDAIIRSASKERVQTLLVGMRLPPNYGRIYGEQFQGMYAELARKHRLPLVPFLLEGIADKPELFQPDGLHPTAAAQPVLMENVWRRLQPLLQR
ncbi:MAG: arylesterase [Pseudomonadota bacterium]|jgi:acyl-CoA thioesterase-1